jgi:uncharacterized membrane protein YgaE (UPF0421/DUF939 family)
MTTEETQLLMAIGGIAALTWFASIGKDSGTMAVAIILILWLVYLMKTNTVANFLAGIGL